MATNGYPHMVFVEPDPGLDKQALGALLGRVFPDASVADKPLRLDLDLDGYVFSFWFEDAQGVAERYATYLPEGARRRWLSRCETMIDLHGAADPDGLHAGDARVIVDALRALEGVEVFSEETRRFVGMEYDDAPGAADAPVAAEPVAAEPVAAEPVPTPVPLSVPAPEPVIVPELAPTPEPALAGVASESSPVPESSNEGTTEKTGFFKRVFGRR